MSTERVPYREGSFSHDEPAELARLRALEAACDPQTTAVITGLGLREDWICAEVGAGAGSVARWLADAAPRGRVLATDTDTGWLAPTENLEVLRHDISAEDLPGGGFDLIHARALLVHLPGRDAVISRLVRSLAPGGWLVIEDPCIFPSLQDDVDPAYRRVVESSSRFVRATIGTDLLWPAVMHERLLEAGLELVGARSTALPLAPGGHGRAVFERTFAQVVPRAVHHGYVTADDATAVRQMLAQPGVEQPYLDMVATWGRRTASTGSDIV